MLSPLTGSSEVALLWAMGHQLIISFLFWKQLHAYEFHRCMLFILKKEAREVELDLGTICSIEQNESSPIMSSCWPVQQQTLNSPVYQLFKDPMPTKDIH